MTRVMVQEKNMSLIFVQNPMQMDMVQFKVLHTTFELTRITICTSVQVIKHLEIGLNLENGVPLYSIWKLVILLDRWRLFSTPDYLAHFQDSLPCSFICMTYPSDYPNHLDYCDFLVKINNNCCLGHFATTNPLNQTSIPEASSELRNVWVYKCKCLCK